MIIANKHTHYIQYLNTCTYLWWLHWLLMGTGFRFPSNCHFRRWNNRNSRRSSAGVLFRGRAKRGCGGGSIEYTRQNATLTYHHCIHKSVNIQNMLSPSIVITPQQKSCPTKAFCVKTQVLFTAKLVENERNQLHELSPLNGTCQIHSLSNESNVDFSLGVSPFFVKEKLTLLVV